MKNRNIVIPIAALTQEEKEYINSLISNGSLCLEESKSINSLLIKRMETFQTQFREVDEDYKRVTKKFDGDFDYLCSVSSRRAELYQQIEKLKKAIMNNKEVIANEEKEDKHE